MCYRSGGLSPRPKFSHNFTRRERRGRPRLNRNFPARGGRGRRSGNICRITGTGYTTAETGGKAPRGTARRQSAVLTAQKNTRRPVRKCYTIKSPPLHEYCPKITPSAARSATAAGFCMYGAHENAAQGIFTACKRRNVKKSPRKPTGRARSDPENSLHASKKGKYPAFSAAIKKKNARKTNGA